MHNNFLDDQNDYSLCQNLCSHYLQQQTLIEEIIHDAEKEALQGIRSLHLIKAEAFDRLYTLLTDY
jgi:hypothetical protein